MRAAYSTTASMTGTRPPLTGGNMKQPSVTHFIFLTYHALLSPLIKFQGDIFLSYQDEALNRTLQ